MTPEERLQSQLHARLPAFASKAARAESVIADALAIPDVRWYVAFSGGVDSTVLLDLVLRQCPDVVVIWGDNGWDVPDTLAFLDTTQARMGRPIIRARTIESFQDWCREMDRDDAAADPDLPGVWGNPCGSWDFTWSLKDTSFDGYSGVFLGLLGTKGKDGGESTRRFIQLRGGHHALYQVASDRDTWHCSPLASWTKYDVWAYIASRNLPYNAAYDTLARLGVPFARRRVSELTCYRAAQYGSHVWLKHGWPDLWNRFAAVFPAVRQFA